jgi:hypothetical protein
MIGFTGWCWVRRPSVPQTGCKRVGGNRSNQPTHELEESVVEAPPTPSWHLGEPPPRSSAPSIQVGFEGPLSVRAEAQSLT